MLQNQNPVRRWKQWLVLPALGGLFLAACQDAVAPDALVPADRGSVTRTYLATQQDEPWRSREETRAIREVLYLDSVRTNGKFEPGTQRMPYVERKPYNPKPGQAQYIIVTVKREPATRPASPIPVADTARLDSQPVASNGDKVYTYVEQMPQLPGGGGQQAIVEAVVSKLTYPKLEKSARMEGRVFVKFTVDATGHTQDVEVVKGLAPAYDAAVLAAVRQLPTFEPGRQDGKAVSVSFTLPVLFTTAQ